ncbi:hypothetical protein NVS78_14075 [Gabonibacter sp. KD22]|nr:hypothetical protein [Gabonibacter chumensis]MCR9013377.1 hypothetical protein [Gabonibacter chumensis]
MKKQKFLSNIFPQQKHGDNETGTECPYARNYIFTFPQWKNHQRVR